MNIEILIVDDKRDIGHLIADVLQDEGFRTRYVESGEKAIEAIHQQCPNIVLLDIWLGEGRMDGMRVLEVVRQSYPHIPIVMMSGHGTIETAVQAMRVGAFDFIEKPFKAEHLILVIQRALDASALFHENLYFRQQNFEPENLVGHSSAITHMNANMGKWAESNCRLFLYGPRGVGKDLFVRTLHRLSSRYRAPFVVLNCEQMNPDEYDAHLFGHEPASQMDIQLMRRQVGVLEQAHNGILFLKEVTYMPLEVQAKFVKFMHTQTFERMGGKVPIKSDVRVITSSSRDVAAAVERGEFREDLYRRLNIMPITIPPLKNRKEDIKPLVDFYVQKMALAYGKRPFTLTPQAWGTLMSYDWPGNVRQLRNVIDGVYARYSGDDLSEIHTDHLPAELMRPVEDIDTGVAPTAEVFQLPLRRAREVFERDYLLMQVRRFSGNVSQTANFVGMERSALHRKLRALGIKEASDAS